MPHKLVTIKVSLPKKLLAKVKRQIKREVYASASEYVAHLIRKELTAVRAIPDAPPLAAIHSRNGLAADLAWWCRLHGAAIGDGDHRENDPASVAQGTKSRHGGATEQKN
jgi:Arc/MetJ-type ribon-helix-helix transcriptional regulator